MLVSNIHDARHRKAKIFLSIKLKIGQLPSVFVIDKIMLTLCKRGIQCNV